MNFWIVLAAVVVASAVVYLGLSLNGKTPVAGGHDDHGHDSHGHDSHH